jgi:hypothetical protein
MLAEESEERPQRVSALKRDFHQPARMLSPWYSGSCKTCSK